MNPWETHFLDDQSQCLLKLGRKEEAVQRLEKALRIKPREVWTRRRLAMLRFQLHGNAPAQETYAPLLLLAPRVSQFWKEMGDLKRAAGDLSSARQYQEQALDLQKAGF